MDDAKCLTFDRYLFFSEAIHKAFHEYHKDGLKSLELLPIFAHSQESENCYSEQEQTFSMDVLRDRESADCHETILTNDMLTQ
jgi:hypothetical protein